VSQLNNCYRTTTENDGWNRKTLSCRWACRSISNSADKTLPAGCFRVAQWYNSDLLTLAFEFDLLACKFSGTFLGRKHRHQVWIRVHELWHILCTNLVRPGDLDLDLWPTGLKTAQPIRLITREMSTKFEFLWLVS